MRLLQVSARSLLWYSMLLVLLSIPVSLILIRAILNKDVDAAITLQSNRFVQHIKSFEYLDDLETDLQVLDQLTYNISIQPATGKLITNKYETIYLFDSLEQEMKPFRTLASPVIIQNKPYILMVRMSLVDNNELIMAISLVQVTVSLLLAVGLLWMNSTLSKRLWKPFYKTLDQLKAYDLDKSESVTLEKSEISEFDDLNKTVYHLTERNRKIFTQQKEFIENAAHELQTPIAIFQSKLDYLMQSPMLSQSQADAIMELESTAQRMARLNKNLLLLSKIDNEQFVETEEVELSSMIQALLSTLRPMAHIEHIQIATSTAITVLSANRTLIEVLLTNLFHNAIRYSSKNELIGITLHQKKLRVTNKGIPINMDLKKMTERFSKDTAQPGSTGIGLAIVKKICDIYDYELQYSYEDGLHTFSVAF